MPRPDQPTVDKHLLAIRNQAGEKLLRLVVMLDGPVKDGLLITYGPLGRTTHTPLDVSMQGLHLCIVTKYRPQMVQTFIGPMLSNPVFSHKVLVAHMWGFAWDSDVALENLRELVSK